MDSDLLDLIRGTQATDASVRTRSESELQRLGKLSPDSVGLGLTSIGSGASETSVRQLALLLLKNLLLRSWNIGFTEYEGPPISPDAKSQIRHVLFELISSPERKVRSLSALILSKIISVEFPEEWPNLIEDLVGLIKNGDEFQISGALAVLNEVLYDSFSEQEFFRVGPTIISVLYEVATSYKYIMTAKADAIQCFTSCLQYCAMSDDDIKSSVDSFAGHIIKQWAQVFVSMIDIPIDTPNNGLLINLKVEVMNTIEEIESIFPEFYQETIASIFASVWKELQRLVPLYYGTFVEGRNRSQFPTFAMIQYNEVNDDLLSQNSIVDLAMSMTKFLENCLGARKFKGVYNEIVTGQESLQLLGTLCLQLAQLPADIEEDVNEFVTEEIDLSLDHSCRMHVAGLVSDIQSTEFTIFLSSELVRRCSSSTITWSSKEAALYLVSELIRDEHSKSYVKVSSEVIRTTMTCILQCQASENYMIRARSLIAGSRLASRLTKNIEADVAGKCLAKSLVEGIQNTDSIVKAASLISIKNLESMFKTEMQGHQSSVLNIISSLVEVAEEDTPAFLVEMLRFAAYINIQEAVKSSDIIRLLFTLASKDTSNVELNTVTSEVFEDMVESATESQQYLEICSNSLPSLLESVKSIQDWEYNPNLVLALSLIASLIEKGPEPLPLEVADYVVDPLYRILSNSTDDQVIQVASAAFSFLVDKCSLQLRNWKSDSGTGPQIILSIASNLLNPQFSDSATINCGHLISIIISKYGTDLGEVLTQLLEATAQRLSTAHNLLLVESLVSVFTGLVLQSPKDVVDILERIQIDGVTGLSIVMNKWLSSFDIIKGYETIKKNIVALENIFNLNDPRIKAVIVDGDLIVPEGEVIVTRSKSKNLVPSRIHASLKILKLLIKELSQSNFNVDNARNIMGHIKESDDEWEDEYEEITNTALGSGLSDLIDSGERLDTPGRTLDAESGLLISNWLSEIKQSPSFYDEYFQRLSTDEQKLFDTYSS